MNKPETQLRHGRVVTPASRGSVAVERGLLGNWQVNEMEGGKNFPASPPGRSLPPMKPMTPASRHLAMGIS